MKRVIGICVTLCMVVGLNAQELNTWKYKGFVDVEGGIAYNLNTAQTVSTINMQFMTCLTTTHGVAFKNVFLGAGLGYYRSYRDNENIYPFYLAGRYTFAKGKLKPFLEARGGIVYDAKWIETTQLYGSLTFGVNVYKRFQIGCRGVLFTRPSRYFTTNASVVLGYEF